MLLVLVALLLVLPAARPRDTEFEASLAKRWPRPSQLGSRSANCSEMRVAPLLAVTLSCARRQEGKQTVDIGTEQTTTPKCEGEAGRGEGARARQAGVRVRGRGRQG